MISKVREIAREIVDNARYVTIDSDSYTLHRLSKKIKDASQSEWQPQLPEWYTKLKPKYTKYEA